MHTIEQYFDLNTRKAELEKRLKPINEWFKKHMTDNSLAEMNEGSLKMELKEQDRSKMNEDKLVQLLTNKGLGEALGVKVVPKSDVVERLTYEGVITPTELSECFDKQIVKVLTVKKVGA